MAEAVVTEAVVIRARWSLIRRLAGFGAASTLALYLLVKVVWVITGLFGGIPGGVATPGWVMLNVVTVGMSLIGVALGLALAQSWGMRLPGVPVLFVAWVGAGFLVPMIPFMVASAIVDSGVGVDDGSGVDDGGGAVAVAGVAPAWADVLLTIGFAGMAVGMAVGLPIYLRERWPYAFLGRLGDRAGNGGGYGNGDGSGASPLRLIGIVVAAGLGLLWVSWAFGGTVGTDPARFDPQDLNGRLLHGISGFWAFVGALAVAVIVWGRPAGLRRWIPMVLAFGASGFLFSWGSWRLLWTLLPFGGYVGVEYPIVAVVGHAAAIVVGAVFLGTVVRAGRGVPAESGGSYNGTGVVTGLP